MRTQQKSERRVVPQARRKTGATEGAVDPRGGKATPVEEQTGQLALGLGTAERPGRSVRGVVAGKEGDRSSSAPRAMPKPSHRAKRIPSAATMSEVCNYLREAFEHVASNRGAAGPDGQDIDEVREHLDEIMPSLEVALREGSYRPGDIRRVWIPKAGGGQRGLGIPNVVDRLVQEAVRLVLEPV